MRSNASSACHLAGREWRLPYNRPMLMTPAYAQHAREEEERGQTLAAIAYASTSVVLSIGALFGGPWLIRTLVLRVIL